MFRKIITSTLLSLVIVGGLFVNVSPRSEKMVSFVSETYAACGETGQPACTEDEAIKKKYNEWLLELNQALYFLTFAVSPAIMLAGWLMSPDWTSGELFGIRPLLHDLWVVISNVTYLIYAILLIFIALATIFNSQNYGYKKLLPRLALGIILVPLTWWFVQFIISLSSVVTASVINIPLEAIIKIEQIKSPGTETWLSKPSIPKTIVHDGFFGYGNTLTKNAMKNCVANPGNCISPKDILTSSSGMFGGLLVYAYGIFRFQDNFEINSTADAVKVISQLIHQGIIMALMFLVFGILVIALIFMLLMRAIKLWFYAIFSPFLTLRYVVGDGIFGAKENSESFELKEFIGLAFVPAIVGLALSFGIVFVAAMHFTGSGNAGTPSPTCMTDPTGCTVTLMDNPNNKIVSKIVPDDNGPYTETTISFGGVDYVYWGSVSGFTSAMAELTPSALSAAGGIFGTIIIDIIALMFVWAAFMAGKNITKVARAAFEPFEAMGKKVGNLAMDMPKYTPIPGTGGWSLKSAEKAIDLQHSQIREKGEMASDDVIRKTFPHLLKGIIKPEEMSKLDESIRANNAATSEGMKKILATRAEVEAKGDANRANYNAVSERSAEVFKSNSEILKKVLDDKKILGHDGEIVAKYLKKEELSETERAKAHQIVQQKFNGSSPDTPGANGVVGGFSSGRITGSDKVNITLNGGPGITIGNKAGEDAVTLTSDEFEKQVRGKTGVIDRLSLRNSLMASNALTDKAAEAIVKKIEELNPNYFTSAISSATKKSDQAPAQAAAPQNPTPPTNGPTANDWTG